MPSRPTLTLTNAFTLIVESQNTAQPNINWRNTWDIFSSTGAPAAGSAIVNAIVGFHQANLRSDCNLSKLIMRNWSQGPQPFADRPFLWEQLLVSSFAPGTKQTTDPTGYGAESTGIQRIPGSVVLFAKRLTVPGSKPTNMFLRGLLDDDDLNIVTAGPPVFAPSPNVTGPKFNDIQNHFLSAFCTGLADPRLIIVHVGNHHAGPAFESSMTSIEMVGPSQNKQTRKNPR